MELISLREKLLVQVFCF